MDSKIFKVAIEGQTMELPGEIAGDDTKLKQALAPYFPGAANAKIVRAEAGDVVTVNVIKQAGTKGAANLAVPVSNAGNYLKALDRMPASQNPVILLYAELITVDRASLSAEQVMELSERIGATIEAGEKQHSAMADTLDWLKAAQAAASETVPAGM